jgi:outer membrane protein
MRLFGGLHAALWSLSGVFLFAGTARAETPAPAAPGLPTARTMTIAQALSYAHEHQPAIHAALARVAARTAEAKIASAQWLPTVSAAAELFGMTANNTTGTFLPTDVLDVPRIGATPAVLSSSNASWSPHAATFVGAGLQQEVFDFGRIGAQRAAADALAEASSHRADADRLDVDFGVEEAYFSVLAAKGIVKASDEAYERARVDRDFAKRGVDSGLRSPMDLTRAEADLARFDVDRVRSRGGLAIAQSVLAAAIGSTESAVDVAAEAPLPADMPTLADAIRMAQTRDPRLVAAFSELKAAEEHTRAVGAELRPDLSFTATISGRAGGAPAAAGSPSGAGWLPNIPNWDVGLVLVWPIFEGTIVARRDAAKSEEQVRRDEVDLARLNDVARVRKAFAEVAVARNALVALQNEVIAAKANYDQADARFRAGLGNAVELADAEAVRTYADIQLALGEFEVARARAAFGRAIAEGL